MRRTAVSRPRRGAARALASLAVVALVSAVATGCGDNGGSDSDEDEEDRSVSALTEEQISEAVLQEDNLGDGWTATPSSEDDSVGPGCFGDIDMLTEEVAEEAKGGTEFAYGEAGLPFVESSVTSYEDEEAIVDVFEEVKTVLAECSTISDTDGDGIAWDLAMTYDDAATQDDVDDQFRLSASGTLTQPGQDPTNINIEWTSVRLGPNVGTVATIDTQERPTEHETWAGIAFERLVDVAEDDEPEETTAPAPSVTG